MNFEELLMQRYSCRNYSDKKVSSTDLNKIVNAGRLSPSARNSQPCEYYVVQEENNVVKIREFVTQLGFNAFVSKVSSFIVITLSEESFNQVKEGKRRNFTDIDTGLACHAMCLEATSLGLASCMIGAFNQESVAEFIGISDAARVKLILAVGYSLDEKIQDKNQRRKKMEEVVKYL